VPGAQPSNDAARQPLALFLLEHLIPVRLLVHAETAAAAAANTLPRPESMARGTPAHVAAAAAAAALVRSLFGDTLALGGLQLAVYTMGQQATPALAPSESRSVSLDASLDACLPVERRFPLGSTLCLCLAFCLSICTLSLIIATVRVRSRAAV
jgi:hypothetical protein